MNSDYANLTLLKPNPGPACLMGASLAITAVAALETSGRN
jgi:hypothetical protein